LGQALERGARASSLAVRPARVCGEEIANHGDRPKGQPVLRGLVGLLLIVAIVLFLVKVALVGGIVGLIALVLLVLLLAGRL
jgi:hypothetical protein